MTNEELTDAVMKLSDVAKHHDSQMKQVLIVNDALLDKLESVKNYIKSLEQTIRELKH
jgi:hypothetical protein